MRIPKFKILNWKLQAWSLLDLDRGFSFLHKYRLTAAVAIAFCVAAPAVIVF